MATSADVPNKYDLVINGKGYMLDRRPDVNAELTYTPTFLQRTNVSGAYGDNEQDYFLTLVQKDWIGGEGQTFFRDDDVRRNRFFECNGVNITTEGQVQLEQSFYTFTPPEDLICGIGRPWTIAPSSGYVFSSANCYTIGAGSTGTAHAHGAGGPGTWGAAIDQNYVYLAGSSKIRKSADGTTWSDFSAQGAAGSVVFHNNQLYSFDGVVFRSYDSAGTATTLFTFKWAEGTTETSGGTRRGKIISHGSKLYLYRTLGVNRPELWEYDGSSTSRVAVLPIGSGWDAVSIDGIIFLSAAETDRDNFSTGLGASSKGVIYAFTQDGSINQVWRDTRGGNSSGPSSLNAPTLAAWAHYVVFAYQNYTEKQVKMYDLNTGAISTINKPTLGTSAVDIMSLSTCSTVIVFTSTSAGTPAAFEFPKFAEYQASGTITTSLFDFDNSLTKNFRSIKIEWTGAGSVDIDYRTGDTTGSYSNLVTGATSGVEYTLSGVSGRSISLKLTLNKSGLASPLVKRIYLRAAPILQSYRRGTYIIDASGSFKGKTPVMDRSGRPIERKGLTMLQELVTALQSTSVSITDDLGTYTGALEPEQFKADRVGPNEFVITVGAREV